MSRLLPRPILLLPLILVLMLGTAARAADRDRLEDFLRITGFDVALESIRLSADSAPQMLGLEAEDFGSEWQRLVREVFDTKVMHDMALSILSQTLSDELLTHAIDFYGSDLGMRLVEAENRSHMVEDDAMKAEAGALIVEGLERIDSPRVALLNRLNRATRWPTAANPSSRCSSRVRAKVTNRSRIKAPAKANCFPVRPRSKPPILPSKTRSTILPCRAATPMACSTPRRLRRAKPAKRWPTKPRPRPAPSRPTKSRSIKTRRATPARNAAPRRRPACVASPKTIAGGGPVST